MMRLLLALNILLFSPALAFAHTGAGNTVGFLHGFEHPIGGLDHVLAMVAVGLLAYVLGGRALLVVPLSFLAMMVAGFGLGLAQVPVPSVELAIALSSVVIGAVAALGRPVPVALAAGLVGGFAMFHGYAHGTEMPGTMSGFTYAVGFVAATTMLHASGLIGSMGMARLLGHYGRTAARVAGGFFALGGVGLLAGWL